MPQKLPIQFCGTGMYVPQEVLTNQYFADYLDTSEDWILTRTGIRERRRAAPDECTSTLAVKAAQEAIDDAGISLDDIDVLICATATGDCSFPATAAYVQAKLGASEIPAFDVGAACAGFLYGCAVASGFLVSGLYERALVIGAETLTRFTDYEDRSTAVLFGDAAGAAVLARSADPETAILYWDLGCEGSRADHICAPAGGSRLPASKTTVAERLHYLHMRGREVYKFAVLKMQQLVEHALEVTGLTPDDLKLVIPHQSNMRIIESVREKLGLPMEKMAVNIDRYANTSAASIPTALDTARRDGTLQKGDLVLMVAIGAGLTWSTMLVRL
jgi:3-oxoacyl-[acyl-carrier-protein] synthase-3